MVEQAVWIGLVVVLRRRGDRGSGVQIRRVRAEDAVEQLAQLRVLDRRQQLAQAGLELLDRDLRALGEVVVLVLAVVGGADRVDRDLGPVLRVDDEPALDQDHRAGRGALEALLDVVPGDRLDGAGAVGDDQADEVVAVCARLRRSRSRTANAPATSVTLGQLANEDPRRGAAAAVRLRAAPAAPRSGAVRSSTST